ncbi:MAG: AMP-binding protein [Desulfuromonadales bacterium]|nr:AMP-binding protein [Desulfuromonadales bacterium]
MNLYQILETNAKTSPGKTALVFGKERISYRTLLERVNRLSAGLTELGLRKGDRLCACMPNRPEVVYTFFAAMKLGLIYVGLNVMLKKAELDYILDDCRPQAAVVFSPLLPVMAETGLARSGRMQLIRADAGTAVGELSVRLLIDSQSEKLAETVDVSPADDAMIGYTSGTTGYPKGAVHTHRSILGCLEEVAEHIALTDRDVIAVPLPLFQLSSFLVHVGMPVYRGCTIVLMDKFEVSTFSRSLSEFKVTVFALVPAIMQMLVDAAKTEKIDFSGVRVALTAGGMLPPNLRQEFESRLGSPVFNGYGSTETGLFVSLSSIAEPARRTSAGRVLPHIRIRLVKEDGAEASVGEAGEILIAGERKFVRYWNNDEATGKAIRDGWYASGDIGCFDEEGHLHIVDRKMDMIIRGGFNIYPAELERVLAQDRRIKQIVVIGVPHHRLGEVPKAYVVLERGERMGAEELIAMSRARLANYKALAAVEFVEEDFLPRNALGKVMKKELRKIA